jgi:hypothetical protein
MHLLRRICITRVFRCTGSILRTVNYIFIDYEYGVIECNKAGQDVKIKTIPNKIAYLKVFLIELTRFTHWFIRNLQ